MTRNHEPYSDTAFIEIGYDAQAPTIDAAWDMEPTDEDLLCLEEAYSDTLYPQSEPEGPQPKTQAPVDEHTPDTAFERLNDAVNACALLYEQGRTDLLNEIDPTGELARGDVNAIAAGFMLLQFQAKGTRTAPPSGPRPEDKLSEAMALYSDGKLNMEDAAKMAGLRRTKFKEAVVARYGSTRSRGRAMGPQADAYKV